MADIYVAKIGGDFDSFGAAVTAATDGVDRIVPADSETYLESVVQAKSLEWAPLADCAPTIKGATPLTLQTGAAGTRIVGVDAASRLVFESTTNACVKLTADLAGLEFHHVAVKRTSAGSVPGFEAVTGATQAEAVLFRDIFLDSVTYGWYRNWAAMDAADITGTALDKVIVAAGAWGGYLRRWHLTAKGLLGSLSSLTPAAGGAVIANGTYRALAGSTGFAVQFNAAGLLLDHLTLVGVVGQVAIALDNTAAGAGTRIGNTILQGWGTGIRSDAAFEADYVCFHGNTADVAWSATKGAHNVEADPLLDADLRIAADSPCRDVGADLGYTEDAWGGVRPVGVPDIGGNEFSNPPRVQGITPLTATEAQVDFNQPMAYDLALTDPASYAMAPVAAGTPMAVSLVVAGPGPFPTYVLLDHDEGTGGEEYEVTVDGGVSSQYGEALNPAYDTATMEAIGTAPELAAAVPAGPRLIRATFDEAMDPASLADAGDWGLALAGGTAPGISGITAEAGNTSFLLALDAPMVAGGRYTVTAPVDATDAAGNTISEGARTAGFVVPWFDGGIGIRVVGSSTLQMRLLEVRESDPETMEV